MLDASEGEQKAGHVKMFEVHDERKKAINSKLYDGKSAVATIRLAAERPCRALLAARFSRAADAARAFEVVTLLAAKGHFPAMTAWCAWMPKAAEERDAALPIEAVAVTATADGLRKADATAAAGADAASTGGRGGGSKGAESTDTLNSASGACATAIAVRQALVPFGAEAWLSQRTGGRQQEFWRTHRPFSTSCPSRSGRKTRRRVSQKSSGRRAPDRWFRVGVRVCACLRECSRCSALGHVTTKVVISPSRVCGCGTVCMDD